MTDRTSVFDHEFFAVFLRSLLSGHPLYAVDQEAASVIVLGFITGDLDKLVNDIIRVGLSSLHRHVGKFWIFLQPKIYRPATHT